MRRLAFLAALAAVLAAPTLSLAGESTPGDGTLSIKRGRGVVILNVRGAILFRVAKGRITAKDPDITDGSGIQVAGCDNSRVDRSDDFPDVDVVKVCKGTDLKLRAIGGRYQVIVTGSGIFGSVVARGVVKLHGANDPTVADGVYSLNGDDYKSLPEDPLTLTLAAPTPSPGG